MSVSCNKETEETRNKVIGTHNGIFHCDEIIAIYMLTTHTKDFINAKIIRSRAKEDWANCDIIVDVGGEFDVSRNKFDHHQQQFQDTFSNNHQTKLSSAGLIYKYFGEEIIAHIADKLCQEKQQKNLYTPQQLHYVYTYVYSELIESIDAEDNGISQYATDTTPKYRISTHLSSRIARLNLNWTETNEIKDKNEIKKIEMERFKQGMKICGEELIEVVRSSLFSSLPAKEMVEQAIDHRFKTHLSGQIIEIPRFCPWTDHFFDLETHVQKHSTDFFKPILFVIFCNNNEFFVRAVPKYAKSFELRKKLKEEWCGVADERIEQITGIQGLKFIHVNGFFAGAKTREAAFALAVQSL